MEVRITIELGKRRGDLTVLLVKIRRAATTATRRGHGDSSGTSLLLSYGTGESRTCTALVRPNPKFAITVSAT